VKEKREWVEKDAHAQSHQDTPHKSLNQGSPPRKIIWHFILVKLQLPLAREHLVDLTSMPLQTLKKWVCAKSTILEQYQVK